MVPPMRTMALVVLLGGCAGPSTPAPATAEDAAEPGHLDPGLFTTAREARSVEKMVVEVGATGDVEEIAVYHRDETKIPAPVRRLAEERFPGSHAVRYETEHERGRGIVYEIEIETADARRCEVQATEAGELLYTECQVTRGDLPAAVVSAVDRLLPSNEFVEAEKKERGDETTFSVEARLGGVVHYVRLSEGGEVRGHSLMIPAVLHLPVP